MKLGQIDFPPELIGEIRDGKLVVFAGAGVSKGEPAGLPLFNELACKIAEICGETRRPREAIDQFLGRLVSENGNDVNKIAAQLLTDTDPEPTELHRDLLRLFKGEPDKVRLVTTNFDLLFEAASDQIFGSLPSVFRASALPRGDEFTGIVHVHGDVTVDADIVLTDEDFGRAYLTGGWARRFLVALFQTKPVLFVGYSHSDTIMEYLARAMPVSTPPRFILTDDPDGPKWSRLGIQPIVFPKSDFEAQNEGVAKLAAIVNRGATDWRDMIRNAARSQPSALSDEDADVLHFGLSDAGDALTNVRVFTSYAMTFEWVTWLDQRGLLAHLFDQGEFDDKDSLYAGWIASKFARQDADAVFRLIGDRDLRLHPHFWYRLAYQVGSRDDAVITCESLGKWVSILLSKATGATYDDFASILERCVEFGRLEDALDILEVVARPNIHRISSSSGDTLREADVRIGSDKWHLGRMMSALQSHMPDISERLVGIATGHLASQHRQLVAWELADRDFSQPSVHRETIEGELDTTKANSEDILIDMARDSLVWLAQNDPTRAAAWIDRLSSSDVPLLRRLASFAIAELPE